MKWAPILPRNIKILQKLIKVFLTNNIECYVFACVQLEFYIHE